MCGVNCICSNVGVVGCDVVMDGCVVLDDWLWSWRIQVWCNTIHNIQIKMSIFVYVKLYCIISITILCDNRYNDMIELLNNYPYWFYVHSAHTCIHIHFIQIRHVRIHMCWSFKCWQTFTILTSTGLRWWRGTAINTAMQNGKVD